jgi:hypothetical protein
LLGCIYKLFNYLTKVCQKKGGCKQILYNSEQITKKNRGCIVKICINIKQIAPLESERWFGSGRKKNVPMELRIRLVKQNQSSAG